MKDIFDLLGRIFISFIQYFFGKCVPFRTGGALANPFRTFISTVITKESGFYFTHVSKVVFGYDFYTEFAIASSVNAGCVCLKRGRGIQSKRANIAVDPITY